MLKQKAERDALAFLVSLLFVLVQAMSHHISIIYIYLGQTEVNSSYRASRWSLQCANAKRLRVLIKNRPKLPTSKKIWQ